MKAKRKAGATAGKQQRAAKVAKTAGAAQQKQSFNSSGKSPSIRVFRAGQDRDDAREEWPRVLQMPDAESQQSFAVAQLAVQLCGLQREQLKNSWNEEDVRHKQASNVAVLPAEKADVIRNRKVEMDRRIKTLDPEGFLPVAWRLLRAAHERATRPMTVEEYVAERGSSPGTEEAVIAHLRRKPIPFHELCDPKLTSAKVRDYKVSVSDPKQPKREPETVTIKWSVYRGEKAFGNFQKLFWEYWDSIRAGWRDAAERQQSLFDYPNNEVAEIVTTASDAARWRALGASLLDAWARSGIRLSDLLSFWRFRETRRPPPPKSESRAVKRRPRKRLSRPDRK